MRIVKPKIDNYNYNGGNNDESLCVTFDQKIALALFLLRFVATGSHHRKPDLNISVTLKLESNYKTKKCSFRFWVFFLLDSLEILSSYLNKKKRSDKSKDSCSSSDVT